MTKSLTFSIVIPAYNQADFLTQAIQSVLDQTYPRLEVIVVNDASPDHTAEIVKQFDDPRVRYIEHPENRGLPASRNTGMKAASGEIIALLDSDDYFHPKKLETHLHFLQEHPDIGVTYNARYQLNYSSDTIRELYSPPLEVGLADFVRGFPFAPSEMVIRRKWAFQVGLFNEDLRAGGEDLDFPCRLALEGCKFANVGRALNYRRHHSGRYRKNLAARRDDFTQTLNAVFSNPRCPTDVLALRESAFSHHYLVLVYQAFAQEKMAEGQEFARKAVKSDPSLLDGAPSKFIHFMMMSSAADENLDHTLILKKMFEQLPPEFSRLSEQYNWAAGQGYLVKGTRALIWDRVDDGQAHFAQAKKWRAQFEPWFLKRLTRQLLDYENEFGATATQKALDNLLPYLEMIGPQKEIGRFKAAYAANQAFKSYRAGEYGKTPQKALKAIMNNPKYLIDRGILSILIRSILQSEV